MTLEQIKQRVAEIAENSWDSEAAHRWEDSLQRDFIAYVSRCGDPELAEKAALVLSTGDLDFDRWCA